MPPTRSDTSPSATWKRSGSPAPSPSQAAAAGLKNSVSGRNTVEPIAGFEAPLGRHRGGAKRVLADDLQRVVAIGKLGIDLEHGARHRDLRQARELG